MNQSYIGILFGVIYLFLNIYLCEGITNQSRICHNEPSGTDASKKLNTTLSDVQTHCVGIRRFDFISHLDKKCSTGNVSFPPSHHQCRLDGTSIDTLFGQISGKQSPVLILSSIQCNNEYDEFVLEYDSVPLMAVHSSSSRHFFKMSELCNTIPAQNITFLSVYAKYDNGNENETECVCYLNITETTTLTLYTYDNRLLQDQEMTLLFGNKSELKKWKNESDFEHVVDTNVVTVKPQVIFLHWKNSSLTDGGHFFIGIEGNTFMTLESAPNSLLEETTTASLETTTSSLETTTVSRTTTSSMDKTTGLDNVTKYQTGIDTSLQTTQSKPGQAQPTTTVKEGDNTSDSDSNGNIGLIVGVVVGLLLLIILIIVICCCVFAWKRKKKRRQTNPEENTNNSECKTDTDSTGQDKRDADGKEHDVTDDITLKQKLSFPPLPNPSNSRYLSGGPRNLIHSNENKSEHTSANGEAIDRKRNNVGDRANAVINDDNDVTNDATKLNDVDNDLRATTGENDEKSERKAHKKKKRKKKKRKHEKNIGELLGEKDENDHEVSYNDMNDDIYNVIN